MTDRMKKLLLSVTVVMICQTESRLLEISETDYSAKRSLNETLGDCCVKLKCYEKAIECYRQMLEVILKF